MTDRTSYPGLNLGPDHSAELVGEAEVAVFGFWVFVMSDIVLFGMLLATYLTALNPMGMAGGPTPAQLFSLPSLLAQTLLLLTSSITFGMATLALRHHRGTGAIVLWLAVTMALGLGFLVLEGRDFADMIAQGAVPQRSGFLSAFFLLVPMHGLHLAAGLLWMAVTIVQLRVLGLRDVVKTRLLRLGVFWHFLDIVWIGIFTMAYLVPLSS